MAARAVLECRISVVALRQQMLQMVDIWPDRTNLWPRPYDPRRSRTVDRVRQLVVAVQADTTHARPAQGRNRSCVCHPDGRFCRSVCAIRQGKREDPAGQTETSDQ